MALPDMHGSLMVALMALASRLALLAVGIVSDALFPDYDSSAELHTDSCDAVSNTDHTAWFSSAVRSSVVWDSVYFERLARCGYEFEHFFAFFPGLPALMQRFSAAQGFPWTQIAGFAVSVASFVLAAVLLYRIGVRVTRDPQLSAVATILLCISPASVFLTYSYTESLFLLCTLAGVWVVAEDLPPLLAAAPFAASCAVRSNGAVNGGFLLYTAAHAISSAAQGKQRWSSALRTSLQCALGLASMVATLWGVLQRGYATFCTNTTWRLVPRPFCQAGGPSLYRHVQAEYWGVGFLRYFQFKQVPNFALASPMAIIAAAAVSAYIHRRPLHSASVGGLLPTRLVLRMIPAKLKDRRPSKGFYSDACFVFVAQLAAMAAFSVLFMHVQVLTRFLSSAPALYWFMAELVLRGPKAGSRAVVAYSAIWGWAGLVLFPNFYPWT